MNSHLNPMSELWRQAILTLSLILLFAASTWLVYRLDSELKQSPDVTARLPDYLMHRAATIKLNSNGHKQESLQAEDVRHYPDGEIELDRPNLVLFTAEQPVWQLRSEYGRVDPGGDVLWFLGDAHFEHYSNDGNSDLEILSRDVRVEPQRGYAETVAPATLINIDGTLHGTGLKVWAQEQRFELLADVQGQYQKIGSQKRLAP